MKKKDKDQEIDDFNDFVEVTFEHKDYPKIEDENYGDILYALM